MMYESVSRIFDHTEHVNGVPWWEAPIPRRLHRCRIQTRGTVKLDRIDRCACGAIRFDGYGPWVGRNNRRKNA